MQPWEIRPFDGVGSLKFGMSRSTAREILGAEFRTFRKTRQSESETDAYDKHGLHLYYDTKDDLNFVEAFPRCALSWNQVKLFQGGLQTIVEEMLKFGEPAISDSSGCYFEGVGISIYAPYSGKIESVGVFRQDKWKEYLQLIWEIAEKNRLRAERRKTRSVPKNPFRSDEEE